MNYSFELERGNGRKTLRLDCVFFLDSRLLPNMLNVKKINCISLLFTARSLLFQGTQKRWNAFCAYGLRLISFSLFFSTNILGSDVLSIKCARGPVSQSGMMNYDRTVIKCPVREIDSFTAWAGQQRLAGSFMPAVAENDFTHGLLLLPFIFLVLIL